MSRDELASVVDVLDILSVTLAYSTVCECKRVAVSVSDVCCRLQCTLDKIVGIARVFDDPI